MSLQELRFRATHLDTVRAGTKRITMRFNDPVEVGPATLVFEFDDEVRIPGRIVSTLAKRVDSVTEDEAREDGFATAADVLPGLRDYYPELQPGDELVIVRFEVGSTYPQRMHTALDAVDWRGLAEFYRVLLGLQYRPGDEPPTDGTADEAGWLVLVDEDGNRQLAINQVDELTPSTWPSDGVPKQMHLDYAVPSVDELHRHRQRAEELGARLLYDRTADEGEPLYVLADPAGHPFCLLVGEL